MFGLFGKIINHPKKVELPIAIIQGSDGKARIPPIAKLVRLGCSAPLCTTKWYYLPLCCTSQ
jgi:hypothetical protein